MNQKPKIETQGPFPGVIWGYDIADGVAAPIVGETPTDGLRWLHVSLSDARARRWLADSPLLPDMARDALLSADEHDRVLVDDDGAMACVIHDWAREFDEETGETLRPLRLVLLPGLILTARQAPVRTADLIKRRLEGGAGPSDEGAALDLLVGLMLDEANSRLLTLTRSAHDMEDALIESDREPTRDSMRLLRRRSVQLLRLTSGLHSVLDRLEGDEAVPPGIADVVERLVQRAAGLERDATGVIAQERMLREELGVRAADRSGRNLFALSLMTALMLPPTLVAGLFGMNTGGLPFASGPHGTLAACLLAAVSAGAVYFYLRRTGFFRRSEN